jgi:hypothetical protein
MFEEEKKCIQDGSQKGDHKKQGARLRTTFKWLGIELGKHGNKPLGSIKFREYFGYNTIHGSSRLMEDNMWSHMWRCYLAPCDS